jgi:hypothetical protein
MQNMALVTLPRVQQTDRNKNKQKATKTGHAEFIWLSDNASRFRWTVNYSSGQIVTTATREPSRASVAYGHRNLF